MVQIVDLGKSIASSSSQSITLPILGSPASNTLSEFGLSVSTGGNVLIHATIGLQTTLGSPDLLFTVVRSGVQIFTIRSSGVVVNSFNAVSFSFVDANVPTGYYAYTVTVSNTSPLALNLANVVGPIIFSGLSLTSS